MATKNKIKLSFEGFKELIEDLDKLGGDLKSATEEALIKSKAVVTEELKKVTVKENFPAKGKYSTGLTAKSIDESTKVKWIGVTGEISVGYDFDISGMRTIYLMYGTPRMKKVQKMYNAIYGAKMKKAVQEKQKEIFQEAIQKRMG